MSEITPSLVLSKRKYPEGPIEPTRVMLGVGELPVLDCRIQPVRSTVELPALYNSIHSSLVESFVPIHAISLITKEPTGDEDVGDGDKLTTGDGVGDGDSVTNGEGDTDIVGDKEMSGELVTTILVGDGNSDTDFLGDNVTRGDGDIFGDTNAIGDNVTNPCFVTMGVTSDNEGENRDSSLLIVAERSRELLCLTNTAVSTRTITAMP